MSLETNLEVWALIERQRTRMVTALETELDKRREKDLRVFNSEKKLRSRITVFKYMKDLDNNIPIWNMSSCFLAQKFFI